MAEKTKVGIVGIGNISGIYLKQMTGVFDILEVKACADLDIDRAKKACEEYEIPVACTVDELFADPEIDIVVNLTIPNAHYSVAKAALEAGKSVHNEKPVTISRAEAKELLAIAKEKNLLVGSAPDTFMGAGIQTCRKLIDDGWIGKPIGCSAYMMCPGHERWHPAPEFYYHVGGGPMFDMGPYYLTALVSLLGPVESVAGSTRISFPERTITSKPKYGQKVEVEVPTHINGLMNFANGVSGTISMSFDVCRHSHSPIEIYGTEGTLWVPDPNGFGGAVKVKRGRHNEETMEVPHTHKYNENSRGIGVADMAYALKEGRVNRCSGDLAYHVLDLMHAFHDAADQGAVHKLESSCDRPAPMPMNPVVGTL